MAAESFQYGRIAVMKQKILFISRNYPPKIGGLETYSYNLIKEFEQHHIVHKIVLSRSIVHLLWFLPYCLVAGAVTAWRHSIGHIHLCDGLLSPVGIILKLITRAHLSVSIHGLDITYRNVFYQLLVPRCTALLDKTICVSHATRNECRRRGVPDQKSVVIPNGIRPDELYLDQPKEVLQRQLEPIIGRTNRGKKILVTVGRLVKRKGVTWFLDSVTPRLDSDYIYIIAGDGPELASIREMIRARAWEQRVFAPGRVTGDVRKILYNAADIFVMPNITVADDIEGFGIAIIEAGSCGLPVVASNLQGIKDAVIDKKTGYLVDEGDIDGFQGRIKSMNLDKVDIRSYVNARFNWATIYRSYQKEILECSTMLDSNAIQ
jgi:glycosyltransferase involved in cell wall biosynthesis